MGRKIMERIEKLINTACVVFLACQVFAIIVMVFGRYFFNHVPRAAEEISLFCMVWFSLLSISLSIRDDSHIKMEIMNLLVSPQKLRYFQYFAALLSMAFSILMVRYGYQLVRLTANTLMPGFQVSEGWLYLAIPVSGFFMTLANAAFLIEMFMERKDAR